MNNKLALGTVQFGLSYGIANKSGQVPLEEVTKILEMAWNSGVDTIDTAIAYGESETVLGKAGVQTHPWKIVSKLPGIPDDCMNISEWINDQVDQSLKRLKADRLYALLLHRSSDILKKDGDIIYSSIQKLKHEHKIFKFGVSIYKPEELEIIYKKYQMDIIQAPMNLIDQRMESSGWLENLAKAGIEIHIRSAFLQGLLLFNREKIPVKFQRWNNLWDKWHSWLNNNSTSAVCSCLGFLNQNNLIDKIVVGVDSQSQLNDIINCMKERKIKNFPDIKSDDNDLINPSMWAEL